jgi:hypothetical protein
MAETPTQSAHAAESSDLPSGLKESVATLDAWLNLVVPMVEQAFEPSESTMFTAVPLILKAAHMMFQRWRHAVEEWFGGWDMVAAWMNDPLTGDTTRHNKMINALWDATDDLAAMERNIDSGTGGNLKIRDGCSREVIRMATAVARKVVTAVSLHRNASVSTGMAGLIEDEETWVWVKMPAANIDDLERLEEWIDPLSFYSSQADWTEPWWAEGRC